MLLERELRVRTLDGEIDFVGVNVCNITFNTRVVSPSYWRDLTVSSLRKHISSVYIADEGWREANAANLIDALGIEE